MEERVEEGKHKDTQTVESEDQIKCPRDNEF